MKSIKEERCGVVNIKRFRLVSIKKFSSWLKGFKKKANQITSDYVDTLHGDLITYKCLEPCYYPTKPLLPRELQKNIEKKVKIILLIYM